MAREQSECNCATFQYDDDAFTFISFDCPIHHTLSDEQLKMARKCADAYGAKIAWSYVNANGVLCVVCDMFNDDEIDGFMYVDGCWIEFDPNLDDVFEENLHHVI